MRAIKVLRIETDEGVGVFKNGIDCAYDLIPDACNRHFREKSSCYDTYFPIPQEDGINMEKDSKEWFCSFLSLKQLNELFFPDEIKILLDHGYNIRLLTVTNYQKGNSQVVFTRDSVIKTQTLNSIF